MNNISTVKLSITLIDVNPDRLEEETIKLFKHMKQLKLSNVIEKVKRILEPESNSSEQNKGGRYLPGIIELELEAGEEQISRVMGLVDEKINGKYEVQFVKTKDSTLIVKAQRKTCSEEEFDTLLHKIQNFMLNMD